MVYGIGDGFGAGSHCHVSILPWAVPRSVVLTLVTAILQPYRVDESALATAFEGGVPVEVTTTVAGVVSVVVPQPLEAVRVNV